MKLTTLFSILLLVVTLACAPARAGEEQAEVQTITDVAQPSVYLSASELQDLERLHHDDAKDLADHIGGADKKFWKAVALGAGIVIAIIIIL